MSITRRDRRLRTDKGRKDFLSAVCARELDQADGADSDELQANREQAIKYYHARPRGDEIDNRSTVISTDVADMVNATLAMIVPMISTDAVVEFEPHGEDDEQAAQIESDVVNNVIMERNNGFIEIQTAVKDALLMKNGVMKVRVREREHVQVFDVSGVDAEQRAYLAVQAAQAGNQTITFDDDDMIVVTTKRQFIVHAVPVERISYEAAFSGRLQDIRFFAEQIDYSRSDLIEMGVPRKVVEELQASSEAYSGANDARNVTTKSRFDDAQTRDQDKIDCHECYVLVDLDGDGVSERYMVLIANRKHCLLYEPADLVPYAVGSPFLNAHRLTGESLFDHLRTTQDSKTAFLRQWHDNVTAINNGKFVYDPSRANEEDILNPIAGGGIRARDPGGSVVPLVIPDVSSGIMSALQYEDKRRSERGGASLDLLTADAQLIGETAHGIERQYGSREALASMMARNLAETMIRDIFHLTHEFLRRWANEPFNVRIAGQWQQVDPTQWPERERVNVRMGMSPGQRGHLQNVLLMQQQMQVQAMQAGLDGVLANADTLYRTNQMWLRIAGVDNPDRLTIDPRSPQAQQAIQAKQEQAQQAAAQQAQMMQLMMQLEAAKLAENARQADGTLAHKYYDTNMDAAIAEARIVGEGTVQMERERMYAIERARAASAARGNAAVGADVGGGRA